MAEKPIADEPQSLPRAARVRLRAEIQRSLDDGIARADATLAIAVYFGGADENRLGLVVSRRHGNAVRRNRIKRVIRTAFRRVRHEIPGPADYVVRPRSETSARLTPAAAEASFRQLSTGLTAPDPIAESESPASSR